MILSLGYSYNAERDGGKGAALGRLRKLGYNVPHFIIIPTTTISSLGEEGLRTFCREVLAGELPHQFHGATVAVRSSAVMEDGAAHSYAGQFLSVLNVSYDKVENAVVDVWKSGKNEHAKAYGAHAGITGSNELAIIIQEMIDAEQAGVGFGIHPISGDKNVQVINAVQGLGDKLVSGEENSDGYEVKGSNISLKLTGSTAILNDEQILKVAGVLKRLEHDLGAPQDIEFAFCNQEFYLLQSRPVTVIGKEEESRKTVWDNSNIVESYPGLTLPLTFSFIEKMYAAVYRQFSQVLGVSKKKVAHNEAVYNSMLGLLNGRVYYNLNSWYAALAQLPGYRINAAYMEGMMGVKDKPEIELPEEGKAGLKDYRDIVKAAIAIFGNLRSARKSKEKFVQDFDAVYIEYRDKDFASQPLTQTWNDYLRFEHLMVSQWKAPLVNDFFAMIYFGLLKKLCGKHFPGTADLHNLLLRASEDIITTQPMKLLPQLAKAIAEDEALRKIALTEPAATLWQAIQHSCIPILQQVNNYLEAWGERCMEELKLETVTYREAPEKLMEILQSYIRGGIFSYRISGNEEQGRTSAEAAVTSYFRGKPFSHMLFQHVLKNARYFVSNRENLRYYRTRGFGMVRRMMLGIGAQLRLQGTIAKARDIFYLKLDEIKKLAGSDFDTGYIITKRRQDYSAYQTLPLPQRIITVGSPPPFLLLPKEESSSAGDTNELLGTGCSAGVVRAKVKLIESTSGHSSLKGCILCTYATDPGYVVLFPSAAGILTERGSLLSHAAIVSREMGIACIVGIDGLMSRLKDGDEVLMDGSTGIVKILSA